MLNILLMLLVVGGVLSTPPSVQAPMLTPFYFTVTSDQPISVEGCPPWVTMYVEDIGVGVYRVHLISAIPSDFTLKISTVPPAVGGEGVGLNVVLKSYVNVRITPHVLPIGERFVACMPSNKLGFIDAFTNIGGVVIVGMICGIILVALVTLRRR